MPTTTVPRQVTIQDVLDLLRQIPGWDQRGRPHEHTIPAWAAQHGYPPDELYSVALHLADWDEVKLGRKANLALTFQKWAHQGWGLTPRQKQARKEREALLAHPPSSTAAAQVDPDSHTWTAIVDHLKQYIPRPAVRTYLEQVRGVGWTDGCYLVRVPDERVRQYLDRHIYALVMQAMEATRGHRWPIGYRLVKDEVRTA